MKKQIGIWIDFRNANIIELKKDKVDVGIVVSEIEEIQPVGGARSRQPWGPMDNVSESKFLDRRKKQEKSFYESVMKAVVHR